MGASPPVGPRLVGGATFTGCGDGRLSGWSRTDRSGLQRPDACSPRKVMQVLTPWATSLPPDITSHSSVSAVAVSLVVGVSLGLLSGFLRGRVDAMVMTVVDVTLSFPPLLLALAFVAALGPSLLTIIVVLGLTGWERYTRVVRAEVLALREKDFVEAARAMGASPLRMILRHLLPNTFSSIIVMSTLQVAQAILQEAALSFLGVGTGSAHPTWGQMITLGRDFVSVAWWLATFPGLAILLTVLAINLVGDRLRDALDPRVR